MAIEIPRQITDLGKGADLSMAGQLGQVGNGLATQTVVLQKMDAALRNLNTLQNSVDGLPNIPSPQDIQGQFGNIQGQVAIQLQTLSNLPGGACLDGALGSVFSVANDGYGFISEQMNSLQGLIEMPSEVMDISGLFSQGREFIGSLGVDSVIGAAIEVLGPANCLLDGTDAKIQLESLMGQLGMDADVLSPTFGTVTPASQAAKMQADMESAVANLTATEPGFNLDVSYLTNALPSFTEMDEMASGFAIQAKQAAATSIADAKQAVKDAIVKIPTPPSIW